MRCTLAVLLVLLTVLAVPGQAEPLEFEATAEINSSNVTNAPAGTILTLNFGYDPEQIRFQVGSTYYFESGTAPLLATTPQGLSVNLQAPFAEPIPGDEFDQFFLQSFTSEVPNGWNLVLEFRTDGGPDGWLQGSNALPRSFPDTFLTDPVPPYIELFFTDEFERIREIGATITSIERINDVAFRGEPAIIPTLNLQWLLLLLGLVLGTALWYRQH